MIIKEYIDYAKEETISSLDRFRNETINVNDLAFYLGKDIVADGSWTYSIYVAEKIIEVNWNLCNSFFKYYERKYSTPPANPGKFPELFLCQMMQNSIEKILYQCVYYQFLIEYKVEELYLTDEIVNRLIQEIKMVQSIDFI